MDTEGTISTSHRLIAGAATTPKPSPRAGVKRGGGPAEKDDDDEVEEAKKRKELEAGKAAGAGLDEEDLSHVTTPPENVLSRVSVFSF